jgi:hypothetical protein
MSIKNQLSEIAGYIGSTRGIGHTTAVIKGFNMSPMPVAVTLNEDYGKRIYGEQNYVSLDNLSSLRGVRRPLVMDNSALTALCQTALDELIRLDNENMLLKLKLESIKEIIDVV